MLLLTFSYQLTPIRVHCCRLGRVYPSVPGSRSLGLFSGWQLLLCHPGRVCRAPPGPGTGRGGSRSPQPTAAQTCPPWHLSLMAAHWLQLCCVFFQGLVSFQALGVHMLSPRHQAWAWGAQICASLRNAFSGKRQLAAAGVFPGEKGQDKDSV